MDLHFGPRKLYFLLTFVDGQLQEGVEGDCTEAWMGTEVSDIHVSPSSCQSTCILVTANHCNFPY